MSKEYAMFAITDEGEDMFDAKKYTFSHYAMWKTAKELMFVDINDLDELASKVDMSKRKLTFLYPAGRSGSTLIGKILEKVPRIKIISNPWCFCHINILYQDGSIRHGEMMRRLNISTKIICSKYDDSLLKFTSYQCGVISELANLFPEATSIFNCRTPGPCIKSREIAMLRWLRKKYPGEGFILRKVLPYPKEEHCTKAMKDHKQFMWTSPWDSRFYGEDAATMYALAILQYLWNKEKISLVIHYEDLVENPELMISKLLKILGYSIDDHLESCLNVMQTDSQEGFSFSRVNQSKAFNGHDLEHLRRITRKVFDIYDINMSENASCEELKRFFNSFPQCL